MHKIINDKCPNYFNEYTFSVNDKHRYNTRTSTNNVLSTPFVRTKSGHRTVHVSDARLWNSLDNSSKSLTILSNFRKPIYNCNLEYNSPLDHFLLIELFNN